MNMFFFSLFAAVWARCVLFSVFDLPYVPFYPLTYLLVYRLDLLTCLSMSSIYTHHADFNHSILLCKFLTFPLGSMISVF
ncbi:hypothetical protein K435DRAFT_204343 [Dendrothele bispora CBS 962.96]|uniref:Uncharacterized protein n=1 Tax=Dendrothele bispora (strain CBS 962.96) TaxID=1314807 RepID=A0A4S8KL67_DENBC|nr:hypothetical protein K435DRAFT_204343 [Dendrothele bispora CBS 962.96]